MIRIEAHTTSNMEALVVGNHITNTFVKVTQPVNNGKGHSHLVVVIMVAITNSMHFIIEMISLIDLVNGVEQESSLHADARNFDGAPETDRDDSLHIEIDTTAHKDDECAGVRHDPGPDESHNELMDQYHGHCTHPKDDVISILKHEPREVGEHITAPLGIPPTIVIDSGANIHADGPLTNAITIGKEAADMQAGDTTHDNVGAVHQAISTLGDICIAITILQSIHGQPIDIDSKTDLEPMHEADNKMHIAIVRDGHVPQSINAILAAPFGITIDRKGNGLVEGHIPHEALLSESVIPGEGTMITLVCRPHNMLKSVEAHSFSMTSLTGIRVPNSRLASKNTHREVIMLLMSIIIMPNGGMVSIRDTIAYAFRDVTDVHESHSDLPQSVRSYTITAGSEDRDMGGHGVGSTTYDKQGAVHATQDDEIMAPTIKQMLLDGLHEGRIIGLTITDSITEGAEIEEIHVAMGREMNVPNGVVTILTMSLGITIIPGLGLIPHNRLLSISAMSNEGTDHTVGSTPCGRLVSMETIAFEGAIHSDSHVPHDRMASVMAMSFSITAV